MQSVAPASQVRFGSTYKTGLLDSRAVSPIGAFGNYLRCAPSGSESSVCLQRSFRIPQATEVINRPVSVSLEDHSPNAVPKHHAVPVNSATAIMRAVRNFETGGN